MVYSFSLDSNSNLTEAATGVCNLTKKETLTQVFSYELCNIYKKIFSYRTPPVQNGLIATLSVLFFIDWFPITIMQKNYCKNRRVHTFLHCQLRALDVMLTPNK